MTDFGREYGWNYIEELPSKEFSCHNCGNNICSNEGYRYGNLIGAQFQQYQDMAYIYICHKCKVPTYFNECGNQIPGAKFGSLIEHLPENVEKMYDEARNCFSVNAYTSATLCCRKLLMNIACEKGAKGNESFEFYVDYLNNNGYIPPDGKQWVDRIRKLGNQATHKLEVKSEEDAKLAIKFTSMLLKLIYEFPKLLES